MLIMNAEDFPQPPVLPEPTELVWGLYCGEKEVKQFAWLQDAFKEGEWHITHDCPEGIRPWARRLGINWHKGTSFRLGEVRIPGTHYRAQAEALLLQHEVREL